MFSHIFIGTDDFESALAFYTALMQALGITARFVEAERPWAGWQSSPDPRPFFVIAKPYDGRPHAPGNGQMVAFMAANRAMVDHVYAVALKAGGTSEGAPGLRPEYHTHYYGAYFRDPAGNKLCVASHGEE